MTTARLKVIHAGPHISVQDAGRFGLLRFGVPESGPMDRKGYAIANAALNNGNATPAIEISIGGLRLECIEGTVSFSLAGGGFHVMLDGAKLESWCVATLKKGSTLSIFQGQWGSWAYLAFAGNLNCSRWLGSASTHALSGLGGGKIKVGDVLEVQNTRILKDFITPRPPIVPLRSAVRLVIGPQDRYFESASIETLLTHPFALTSAYDRMGVRLSGPKLHVNAPLDMPSEGLARGSIQVAGDGTATVLLADHQTTGGYPKIATILSCDLDGFAQLRSHNKVRFQTIDPQTITQVVREAQKTHEQYVAELRVKS